MMNEPPNKARFEGKQIMKTQNCSTVAVKESPNVLDTARLEQFKKKREEWVSWSNGEDPHSIWNQIAALLWDYVLFLTINDLRKEAAQYPAEGIGFNLPLVRFLDAGFVVTQVTGIRRLTERQWGEPTKRVISLRALVADIKDCRELLTREVYLACNGLPYDAPSGNRESERAHERFDKLSETSPSKRSREDVVSNEVL
jgi:hypothetical protein